MKMERRDWLNLILFKIGWFVAVVGREDWLIAQLLLITLSLWVVKPNRALLLAVLGVALIGIVRDAALVVADVFDMGGTYMPLWLALLWLQFALVLACGMHWLAGLTQPVQVAVGMVTGLLAYAAAVALGAATVGPFVGGTIAAWAVLTLTWGGLLWIQLKLFPGSNREHAAT